MFCSVQAQLISLQRTYIKELVRKPVPIIIVFCAKEAFGKNEYFSVVLIVSGCVVPFTVGSTRLKSDLLVFLLTRKAYMGLLAARRVMFFGFGPALFVTITFAVFQLFSY